MHIFEINRRLKQRPPFQMVERVTEYQPGERAVGLKCVSVNEPWFAGHFPGTPIMPGVLIIEACAQLCSLVTEADGSDDETLYVLLKVDQFKFLRPVIPGDRLEMTVTRRPGGGPLLTFDAAVTVEGECRARGVLSFTGVPRQTIEGRGD